MSATLVRSCGCLTSARRTADRSGSGTDSGTSGNRPSVTTSAMICITLLVPNGRRPVAAWHSVTAAAYASAAAVGAPSSESHSSGARYGALPAPALPPRPLNCRRRVRQRLSAASSLPCRAISAVPTPA